MDIARSINFESLSEDNDALSTSPKQTYGIDVNRQFDLYTTESMHLPTEAPPIYQKDQPLDGFSHAMPPAPHKPWLSKSPSAPQFVLKTIPHAPTATASGEAKLARQSDEVRQSLQLPRTEAASNSSHFLRNEAINDAPVRHTSPDKNTVLCEVRGASMDFTQPDRSMPGRMGITKGASRCTVRLVIREKHSKGGEKYTVRSIWVIADDGKVCIEQKLPQDTQIVPYTLWSNYTKVIIRHPTKLRFFDHANSEKPYKKLETSWANYVFESTATSAQFQSALMLPLQLIRTLPTTRIIRLHRSPFVRKFSPRLQLCGLENLRVFQDASDPNSLLCMIHYSPNFRPLNGEEYLTFRLYPPPMNSVRIREDGECCVKIKGLDIRGSPANQQKKKKGKTAQSHIEEMEEEAYGSHSIEKIKIEFDSGKWKRQFLGLTRELQGLSSW